MNLLYFLGFMCLWGGQVGGSSSAETQTEVIPQADVIVTLINPDPNDPVLEVDPSKPSKTIQVRKPYTFELHSDNSTGYYIKLSVSDEIKIIGKKGNDTIPYTAFIQLGKTLCYFIEVYMSRTNNLSGSLGRLTDGFYKKDSTHIFQAIEKILEPILSELSSSAQPSTGLQRFMNLGSKPALFKNYNQGICLGIWEYLLEYEQYYGYYDTINPTKKSIYRNTWFPFYKDQAQTILVPIFQKLAAALPEATVKTFVAEKQSMNSYALGQFLAKEQNAQYKPDTSAPTATSIQPPRA